MGLVSATEQGGSQHASVKVMGLVSATEQGGSQHALGYEIPSSP
jgi:hypothetical protein